MFWQIDLQILGIKDCVCYVKLCILQVQPFQYRFLSFHHNQVWAPNHMKTIRIQVRLNYLFSLTGR